MNINCQPAATTSMKMFFHTSKNDKVQSKRCQNCIPFLESTYHEMQRKHIPRVFEYQSSTSNHPVDY